MYMYVCLCVSLLAGPVVITTEPAVDCSLLNISDVITHDRKLKKNMSVINPAMSLLFFSLLFDTFCQKD